MISSTLGEKGVSECVLDHPPCLPYQLSRLADFRFGGVISGIGLMGKLVNIIPDGGQFPEQGGIAVGRTGAEIDAHDELTQQRLHFQAGHLCLLFQVAIFIGAEPQGDGLKYFAHIELLTGHRRNGAAAVWGGDESCGSPGGLPNSRDCTFEGFCQCPAQRPLRL